MRLSSRALSLCGENWARPSESVLFASEKGLNSAIYDALETGRICPHNPLRQLHDKSIGKALQNEKLFSCVCVCVLLRGCSENFRKQFVNEFRSAREDREIGLAV
jgi:hypothetical protein